MDEDHFKIGDNARQEIESALNKFEKEKAGLPPLSDSEAPKWMNMSVSEIKKKTPDQLNEAQYELLQYAIYIQRLINRNKSWERWAKSKLDEITSLMIPKVGEGYGFNERMLMAKNSPDPCKKLNAFLRKIQMENDRLWGIPDYIKLMSNTIKDIKISNMHYERSNTDE